MQIVSVNVAQPRETMYEGRTVKSSIWKEPVSGPVAVSETNLEGDRQASAVLHGGIHKAAYAYSFDHYPWWADQLGRDDLKPGMFGENLTIGGLDESHVRIGEHWLAGSVVFVITGPRIPCSNLAMKFNDRSLPHRFTESGYPGVYLRVLRTGWVAAGDPVEKTAEGNGVSAKDLFRAYTHPRDPGSATVLEEALLGEFLDPDLAAGINKRISAVQGDKQ